MTAGNKLYTGFGALLLTTLFAGIVAIRNITVIGDNMRDIGGRQARLLYLSGDIGRVSADLVSSARAMNMRAEMNDAAGVSRFHDAVKEDAARIRTDGAEFLDNTRVAALRDQVHLNVLTELPKLEDQIDKTYELISRGQVQAARALFNDKAQPLGEALSRAGDDLAQRENSQIKEHLAEAAGMVNPARYLSVAMMLLAFAAGGGVIWVVRGINTVLQDSIIQLNDGAEQVATAAAQVASSSQSLAQGASEQAASLEETSASSEEINSMARKNTDNARQTAELLGRSQEKVTEANRYLEEMVESMNLITDSSGKISKIIKVIDEIAFQTNILALNAAVEAARAGEAGMGFAVVADEVRNLAQRSAQAARDTAILIEDSITRSNHGKLKVDQVALAIREVTDGSSKVKGMIDEVSLGSEEQSRGIDQIGRAISEMEQVTQTNAASAEHSAAAAEELSAQSETLKDVVRGLHNMVGGSGQASRSGLDAAWRRPSNVPALRFRAPASTKAAGWNGERAKTESKMSPAHSRPTAAECASFPMEETFQSF